MNKYRIIASRKRVKDARSFYFRPIKSGVGHLGSASKKNCRFKMDEKLSKCCVPRSDDNIIDDLSSTKMYPTGILLLYHDQCD